MPRPTSRFDTSATITGQVNSLVAFAAELAGERSPTGAAMFWELLLERVSEQAAQAEDRRRQAKRRRART